MRWGLLWQLHSTEFSGARMSKITSLLYLILQQGWEMAVVCWVSPLSWEIVPGSFTVPLPPDSIGIGIMTFYPQIFINPFKKHLPEKSLYALSDLQKLTVHVPSWWLDFAPTHIPPAKSDMLCYIIISVTLSMLLIVEL